MSDQIHFPVGGRKGVLFVDDEQRAGKYFETRFAPQFPVFIATSAAQALEILSARGDQIGVVVSDERMPGCTGVQFLAEVKTRHPKLVRVLTTAYMEMDTLLEAINVGSVFAFVSKPWSLDDLENVLVEALRQHDRLVEDADLVSRKLDELRDQIMEGHAYDIGVIASKLGHYVYNALCPVTFLLDQLIEGETPSHYPVDFLREVRQNVDELVQTLRDLERSGTSPPAMERESVQLRPALIDALQQTQSGRKERRLELAIDLPDDLQTVHAHRDELEKLFRFMIAEEIVSLPKESLLRIKARNMEGESGPGVLLEFEDEAPVSPKVDVGRLMLPFNLRGDNPRELGVFLSCSYMIARRLGGTFCARPKPGRGVVYSFFLPRQATGQAETTSGLYRRIASVPHSEK